MKLSRLSPLELDEAGAHCVALWLNDGYQVAFWRDDTDPEEWQGKLTPWDRRGSVHHQARIRRPGWRYPSHPTRLCTVEDFVVLIEEEHLRVDTATAGESEYAELRRTIFELDQNRTRYTRKVVESFVVLSVVVEQMTLLHWCERRIEEREHTKAFV